ncbi:hypothetical protein HOE67_01530 [Candidatus Peregrinibacteria bacterium]|jgi:hypothetical protein|nr:hypothetical protein [Candidatus Peregrinibacteria bacterium]MBT4055768.1 hypothetical protein [Candidatus Peregrinibacteria bacterium]
MKYLHAVKGSLIAFVIFVLVVVFLPARDSIPNIDLVLTVSTFLFAILCGFFISRLNMRFDKIIANISDEDSYWLSFYRSSKLFGPKFSNKVSNIIDECYTVMFNSDVGNFYYKDTTPYVEALYKELDKLKMPASKKSPVLFRVLLDCLVDIERTRNQSAVVTRERLTVGQWLVLGLLAAIIVFCLLFLKLPLVYSEVLTVLLSTILILVLLIIRDLQNLKLGGYALSVESGQEVFESLGKLRYYPSFLIEDGTIKVPKHVKKYRLGTGGKKNGFKIVTNR